MFINSSTLIFLILLPLGAVFLFWSARRRDARLHRLGDLNLLQSHMENISVARRWWKAALWLMTLAALVLALARPVWGVDETFIEAQGISLIVVLDVSNSMNAQDVQPNRLERAKIAARDLFEGGQGNQLGLILFAGTAVVQFPLTTDSASALVFLNAASTNSISRQGTAIEAALNLAIETFDERIASDQVIVLMTDGENHEGDTLRAAERAAERGIIIHTVGYGTERGEPIPIFDEQGSVTGYRSDAAGNLVLTRLDASTLIEIAEITGGTYQQATNSGIEIVNLLNEISRLEQGVLERRRQIQRVERFGLFVGLALFTLTLEMFLPEVKRREEQDHVPA